MMVKKRAATGCVALLTAAINHVRYQKQVPNLERIARYMLRHHEMDALQVERELNTAVKDGSLEAYIAISKKGANAGMEQDAYRVAPKGVAAKKKRHYTKGLQPRKSAEKILHKQKVVQHDSDHDWYCFECQKSDSLIHCAECWRAWHSDCTDVDVTNPETFVCSTCLDGKKKCDLGVKYLNVLLSYTAHRLREKARELYHLPPKEAAARWNDCVYTPMDLHTMESKAQSRKYRCLEEFVADAKTTLHDVVLTYGRNEPMSLLAQTMFNSCAYDADEVRQCHNCYYMSNLKPPDWFCQPCVSSNDF